jgi:hypothetical protein
MTVELELMRPRIERSPGDYPPYFAAGQVEDAERDRLA